MFPKRPFPQPLTSSAASLPASPSRGAKGLSHRGAFGHHACPGHRKHKPSSDRKLGRAAGPSGSTCALGHNGRALLPGSADLAVGRLRAVSPRPRFGGFWLVALPGPLRGDARVVRFAPAVGWARGLGGLGVPGGTALPSALGWTAVRVTLRSCHQNPGKSLMCSSPGEFEGVWLCRCGCRVTAVFGGV